MMLVGLSALVLGAGLQMLQPQPASPAATPVPVTAVMVMTSLKSEVAPADARKLVEEEVHVAVQLYLDGKIDQWYTRSDGKGAVLFVHCKTVDEAKAVLSGLPFMRAGYLNVEYIPVGPFSGLRNLTRPHPASEGTGPH
jgi:hypothetical protein